MIYNATNLISETFDTYDVKYRISEIGDASVVEAGFVIEAGPEVIVRFISKDNDNDVAVRVFGLVHKVPASKRTDIMEVCNALCAEVRYLKFYVDPMGNVNVEADLPIRTNDDCLGECCFELFIRMMHILEGEYHRFADVLYANGKNNASSPLELLRALQELRDTPIIMKNGETA